jgi:hypothetical protein
MLPPHWSPLARDAVLGALLALTFGQVRTMLRYGPRSRLSLPVPEATTEREPADLDRARTTGV